MKLFSAFLGAIIMAPLLSFCQNIRMADSLTQKAVSNATVVVMDQTSGKVTQQGITNADGNFNFDAGANSNLHISVTAMGYKKAVAKYNPAQPTIFLLKDNKQ